MSGLNEILDETIRAVEQMKRKGTTHARVSRETLEDLGKAPVVVQNRGAEVAPTLETGLKELEALAKACTKCAELAQSRTNVVFGTGNTDHPDVMFVGEAPGRDEDLEGEPFVGRAGELLTKIIQAMGFKRSEVYIANVLKCRPPNNRTPMPDEMNKCLPYLRKQIAIIQPKLIVGLGATAVKALLDVELSISKMRGHWYLYEGVPIMPTFHPAYLLRNPAAKRDVWNDMLAVLDKLGRKAPPNPKKSD